MSHQIERFLPVLAMWGAWGFLALLLVTVLGVWWLGRGRPFLVPARWTGRLAAAALLMLAIVWCLGLYVVCGPMRPMLSQVRQIVGLVNRPAADASFRAVADDAPLRLSELRGKVVVLNLWATWCGPCRMELPEIDRLQKAYAGRGLVVVTVSTEERDRLRAFAAKYPLATLNVYTPRIDWLDVGGRPLSVIIDRDGVVRACFIGARSYSEFERAVTKQMNAAS
jgi:thiol-disulfide isomerase/thioredoxin